MDETGFGEISQEGEGALPDLRHGVLGGQSRAVWQGWGPNPSRAGQLGEQSLGHGLTLSLPITGPVCKSGTRGPLNRMYPCLANCCPS